MAAACSSTAPSLTPAARVRPTAAPSLVVTPPPAGLAAVIDRVAEKALEDFGLVGIVVGVRQGEYPPFIKAYGHADIAKTTPAAPSSAHPIASVTKQFTAAAIMQLAEEGKLSLDDPIGRFISMVPPDWEQVRVRHLLNHTSGVVDPNKIGLASLDRYREHPLEEVTALIKELSAERAFEPGSHYEYSNAGYHLLGTIIESASRMTYGEYLQQHIFDPLDLGNTRFEMTFPANLWQGYTRVDGELQPVEPVHPSLSYSSSGLVSTAADLLQWQRALTEGRVVNPESYRRMITPTKLSSGKEYPYGFGLLLIGLHCENAVRHDGGIPGWETVSLYCPEDNLGLVVLLNSNPADPMTIHRLISRLTRAVLNAP